jgi:hypothetical protein
MILGNHGYNVYDVNKKKNERIGMNGRLRRYWLAIWVWIANDIDVVLWVPTFQMTLNSYPSLDS